MQQPDLFMAYAATPWRLRVLQGQGVPGEDYLLYGLPEFRAAGIRVSHNLRPRYPAWARAAAAAANRLISLCRGYGGEFASVLPFMREMNASRLIFSTSDRVGLPLVLLASAGVIRSPIVYTSIGLSDRLAAVSSPSLRRRYVEGLRGARKIICYGCGEALLLRELLRLPREQVEFIPFGVDETAFAPRPNAPCEVDVVSLGADPCRDWEPLLAVAEALPDLWFRLVTTGGQARGLSRVPVNVEVLCDVSFEAYRAALASARVVALPVVENCYSGATTTLLQAMAMAKPVVVSATSAIAGGYGLVDAKNCRLIPPGGAEPMRQAVTDLIRSPEDAQAMGRAARATVLAHLTWDRFLDRLSAALAVRPPRSARA